MIGVLACHGCVVVVVCQAYRDQFPVATRWFRRVVESREYVEVLRVREPTLLVGYRFFRFCTEEPAITKYPGGTSESGSSTSSGSNSASGLSPVEEGKRAAAYAAVDNHVKSHTVIGLGSGSTVVYAAERLGQLVRKGLDIKAVPSSFQANQLLVKVCMSVHSGRCGASCVRVCVCSPVIPLGRMLCGCKGHGRDAKTSPRVLLSVESVARCSVHPIIHHVHVYVCMCVCVWWWWSSGWQYNIPSTDLSRHPKLDLVIDGADQFSDTTLDLLKGGGACPTQVRACPSARPTMTLFRDCCLHRSSRLHSVCVDRGPFSLVLGPWSLVLGPWSLVLGSTRRRLWPPPRACTSSWRTTGSRRATWATPPGPGATVCLWRSCPWPTCLSSRPSVPWAQPM